MSDPDYPGPTRALEEKAKSNARICEQEKSDREELERLRAIVDRLPVTADGVRVADGDEVFTLDGQCVQARVQLVYHQLPNSIENCYQPVRCCYSTREAAEAAAREKA